MEYIALFVQELITCLVLISQFVRKNQVLLRHHIWTIDNKPDRLVKVNDIHELLALGASLACVLIQSPISQRVVGQQR